MFSGKLSSWQERWLKDQFWYPILLHWRMWRPGTTGRGVTFCYPVPLGPLLRGPCHFGPSCAEKTRALKLVLLLWIVNTVSESMTFVMEYTFHEAIRNPMDNGVIKPVPTPHPKYHHWQYLWSTYGLMSTRWRLQLLRRWLLCKSCILGHYVSGNCGFTVLWSYIYLDSCSSIWKSYILLSA